MRVKRLGKNALQVLRAVANGGEPPQDLRGGAPAVFSPEVCPILLLVVVGHPSLVRHEEIGPAPGPGEVVVGHAPLDSEGGLRVVLPGLATLDFLFLDAQDLVHGLRPVGPKNGAGVVDERLGRAVTLRRLV